MNTLLGMGMRSIISLLFATGSCVLFLLARDDLSKHDNAVSVHERNSGKTLAILEAVANQRLLRLERTLSHLVRLQAVGVFHFLAAGLLSHLPDDLRDSPM